MIALYILAGLCILVLALFAALNHLVNDHKVPTRLPEFNIDAPHTVLAVFAHPDDEVMAAGTLARLAAHGKVHALYCTHGEDGPTGGLVEKKDLGSYRANELAEVARILGYTQMEILDYPDRYLSGIDKTTLQGEIRKRIETYHPDTVICFDRTIGLYGHSDHAFAGLCTQELLDEDSLGVEHLLEMTLPGSMIKLAMKVSNTFRERYDPEHGLSAPTYAVRIPRFAKRKMAVLHAHKTQWQVMGDVQPLWDKIPAVVYYRIFSKEYYCYRRM